MARELTLKEREQIAKRYDKTFNIVKYQDYLKRFLPETRDIEGHYYLNNNHPLAVRTDDTIQFSTEEQLLMLKCQFLRNKAFQSVLSQDRIHIVMRNKCAEMITWIKQFRPTDLSWVTPIRAINFHVPDIEVIIYGSNYHMRFEGEKFAPRMSDSNGESQTIHIPQMKIEFFEIASPDVREYYNHDMETGNITLVEYNGHTKSSNI